MKKFLLNLYYKHDSLAFLNYLLDFWDTNLGKRVCYWLGSPGDVFYNSGGLEPDWHCKRCLEYHDRKPDKLDGLIFWIRAAPYLIIHPLGTIKWILKIEE